MYYNLFVFYKYIKSQYYYLLQNNKDIIELNFFDHTISESIPISSRPT